MMMTMTTTTTSGGGGRRADIEEEEEDDDDDTLRRRESLNARSRACRGGDGTRRRWREAVENEKRRASRLLGDAREEREKRARAIAMAKRTGGRDEERTFSTPPQGPRSRLVEG